MSIFEANDERIPTPIIGFNTGTLYDLMTGSFMPGVDGKWYCNGGPGPYLTGIHAEGNMYKSTTMDAFIVACMKIYNDPDIEAIVYDTEGSKSMDRVKDFFNEPLFEKKDREELLNRIDVWPGEEIELDEFYVRIGNICQYKEKKKAKYRVKTPFIHPATGKAIEVWKPTFVFIDSLSEMQAEGEDELLNKEGLDSGKANTVWLKDGNRKTLLVRKIAKIARKYGIVFILSAHTGDNGGMGDSQYAPPSKQLQFMKQKHKIKNVGSKFDFLTHVMMQIWSCSVLLDGSKTSSLYCEGETDKMDLNEVSIMIQRNKLNASGKMQPFVISQHYGILNTITNYHYLRSNGYKGLVGNKQTHACALMPDKKFTRNSIRKLIHGDYKFSRAMDLMAQYMYIKNNWNIAALPVSFERTAEELHQAIVDHPELDLDKVLETQSTWSYEKQEREYMSIIDLLIELDKK